MAPIAIHMIPSRVALCTGSDYYTNEKSYIHDSSNVTHCGIQPLQQFGCDPTSSIPVNDESLE